MLKIRIKRFFYSIVILLINIIMLIVMDMVSINENGIAIRSCALILGSAIALQTIAYWKFSAVFNINYGLFLLSFIAFNFGQILMYGLGIKFNTWYIERYEIRFLLQAIKFMSTCMGVLFLSAPLNEGRALKYKRINCLSERSIYSIAKVMMAFSGIIAIPLVLVKLYVFMTMGRYMAVKVFEGTIPSLIALIEYLFYPFAILTLLYSKRKAADRIITVCISVWTLITALCGDRTTGIAALVVILLIHMRYKGIAKDKLKRVVLLMTSLIALSSLIVFISSYRVFGYSSLNSLKEIVIDTVEELGFTFLPVVMIMQICPSKYAFLYGQSYLYSLISGIIPASIDFTGTVYRWQRLAFLPSEWNIINYNYSFGVGYTLCTEAYANLGKLGFIALFVIGLVLSKVLSSNRENKFSQYTSMVMLYQFLTLPRYSFYNLVNHMFYCILVVPVMVLFISNLWRRGAQ